VRDSISAKLRTNDNNNDNDTHNNLRIKHRREPQNLVEEPEMMPEKRSFGVTEAGYQDR
jgi:hypothetical protein